MSETGAERGHLMLKAAVETTTDQGVFEAVISTADVDREFDIVEPAAMVTALKAWNRPIPLAWEHSTDPNDIFGTIEPMTVRAQGTEVIAGGQVDLESPVGQAAWRGFKARSLGFSFGYLVPEGGYTPRKGGGKHITALDVFEITATRAPMNNGTRVLSTKALEERVSDLEERIKNLEGATEALETSTATAAEKSAADPLQEASRQAVRDIRLHGIPERKSPRQDPAPPDAPPTEAELRDRFRDVTLQLLREV